MHPFQSPCNTCSLEGDCTRKTPETRYSGFILISAFLHLFILSGIISIHQNYTKHSVRENNIIVIDLVEQAEAKKAPVLTKKIMYTAIKSSSEPLTLLPDPQIHEAPKKQYASAEPIDKTPILKRDTEIHKQPQKIVEPPEVSSSLSSSTGNKADKNNTIKKPEPFTMLSAEAKTPIRTGAKDIDSVKSAAPVQEPFTEKHYVDKNFYYVKDLIMQNITYPAVARRMKWQGTAVITFVVLEDGSVKNIKIKSGSGHSMLDKNITDAIRKAQPFPCPPAAAEFTMPIKYTLTH